MGEGAVEATELDCALVGGDQQAGAGASSTVKAVAMAVSRCMLNLEM